MYNYGINFLNVSHNFKIKGEHIINDLSSSFPQNRFFIVGEKSNKPEKRILFILVLRIFQDLILINIIFYLSLKT